MLHRLGCWKYDLPVKWSTNLLASQSVIFLMSTILLLKEKQFKNIQQSVLTTCLELFVTIISEKVQANIIITVYIVGTS